MDNYDWEIVDQVAGELQAELIRGILEAKDIKVVLSQEGVGHVYAMNIGLFGRVQVLVPKEDSSRAKQILSQYYSDTNDPLEQVEDNLVDNEGSLEEP